jgi:adenylate cyclase
MRPDELVESLNEYFSLMVDIVMNRAGTIDKYIGDAIMALFGAPVHHDDDVQQSVRAGLEMTEALTTFNERQKSRGRPEFRIGVGINYGEVTVGNIGSERKMDYTVIGDMVNVASRLEGLTKQYRQEVLISETAYEHVKDEVACRLLDAVAVKGRKRGLRIYGAVREVTGTVAEAWGLHNAAMEQFFERDFTAAAGQFHDVLRLMPADTVAPLMVERCDAFIANPPPADWDGVTVMETK